METSRLGSSATANSTARGKVLDYAYPWLPDQSDGTYCNPILHADYSDPDLVRVTQVTNDWRKPWPWTRFVATERWAALVDGGGWGLGVFKDDGAEFHGGIHGDARSDDPKDGSTAYVAPIHVENFDHNIVYEHRTAFVVGSLAEIRKRCNAMATRTPPAWRFVTDRQRWTMRNATDGGFPLNGEWRIKCGTGKPHLASAIQCWRAESAPSMELEVAHQGQPASARIFWRRLDDDKFDMRKSLTVELNPDGKFHTYQLDLASSAEYRSLLTGVAIEPVAQPRPGDEMAIRSIVLSSARR